MTSDGFTLPRLYHWSPADRYDAILTGGLRPQQPSTVASTPLPYLCLGFSPAGAWTISGAMEWVSEVDEWDLWQVTIADGDQVSVRPEFGPALCEVTVYGPIPPDRLWHAGRRPRQATRRFGWWHPIPGRDGTHCWASAADGRLITAGTAGELAEALGPFPGEARPLPDPIGVAEWLADQR